MYSTKCFILYTIKYIKRAAKDRASQTMGEKTVPNNVKMFLNKVKAWH